MKAAAKPYWRTKLIRGDHKALEAAMNAGVGIKDYWLHAMLPVAGGFVLVFNKMDAQTIFDRHRRRRLEAMALRKRGTKQT